jgi:hypothetical protein
VRIALVVAISVLGAACAFPDQPPTRGEAEALLRRAIALAADGDFEGLCAMGGGHCERFLDSYGRDVPEVAPDVVGARTLPTVGEQVGGVVLELCGRLDSGARYYTEMLVFRSGGELLAREPVYWSGTEIADDADVGDEPANPASHCPSD